MIKRALTASCIAVMAASCTQAAPVGERLCGGLLRPCLPLRRPGRLLARHGDRARRRLPAWKHDSLRHSGPGRQNPLARTLAHAEGSRSSRQSLGDWPESRPRRRVLRYLAGRLRLSRLQPGHSDLHQPLCGGRSRPAASDQPYRRRIQPGRQDQAQRFRQPGWREGDRQPVVPGLGMRRAMARRQRQRHARIALERQDARGPVHHRHPDLGQ